MRKQSCIVGYIVTLLHLVADDRVTYTWHHFLGVLFQYMPLHKWKESESDSLCSCLFLYLLLSYLPLTLFINIYEYIYIFIYIFSPLSALEAVGTGKDDNRRKEDTSWKTDRRVMLVFWFFFSFRVSATELRGRKEPVVIHTEL